MVQPAIFRKEVTEGKKSCIECLWREMCEWVKFVWMWTYACSVHVFQFGWNLWSLSKTRGKYFKKKSCLIIAQCIGMEIVNCPFIIWSQPCDLLGKTHIVFFSDMTWCHSSVRKSVVKIWLNGVACVPRVGKGYAIFLTL